MTGRILIDGHVHIYPVADRARLLAAALRNLRAAARGSAEADLVLMLTETAREAAFAELRAAEGLPAGWTATAPEADPGAVLLAGPEGARLVVIAGRQIVTAEGLEVLAIGSDARIADGTPVREVLATLEERGLPAILPWGLGKWTGRRGALVAELIGAPESHAICLGDNAGRPVGWRRPPLFDRAAGRGIPVLPGTDPLPLPGAEAGVGRYGFCLDGRLDPARPAADLARRLRGLEGAPEPFGGRRGWPAVIAEQVALRRRKG